MPIRMRCLQLPGAEQDGGEMSLQGPPTPDPPTKSPAADLLETSSPGRLEGRAAWRPSGALGCPLPLTAIFMAVFSLENL